MDGTPLFNASQSEKCVRNIQFRETVTRPICRREIFDALKKMKPRKAVGPGGLLIDVFRVAAKLVHETSLAPPTLPSPSSNAGAVLDVLAAVLSNALRLRLFATEWKKSRLIFIYKRKGSRLDACNYRPLAMLCHLGKLLENVLHARMKFMDADNFALQGGFREDRGVYEQSIMTGSSIFQQVMMDEFHNLRPDALRLKAARAQALLILQDARSAYDTCCHVILKLRLALRGAGVQFLKLMDSYLSGRSGLEAAGEEEEDIHVRLDYGCGTAQGAVQSPPYYNVFADPFLVQLDKKVQEIAERHMRRLILVPGTTQHAASGFADDVRGLYDSIMTANAVCSGAASLLMKYARDSFVDWNVKKFKVIAYGITPSDWREMPVTIADRDMPYPDEAVTHLGFVYPTNASMLMRLDPLPSAFNSINCLRSLMDGKLGVPIRAGLDIFRNVCLQQMLYRAASSIRYTKTDIAVLQTMMNKSLRLVMGGPASSRTHRLYMETGCLPAECHVVVRQLTLLKRMVSNKLHPVIREHGKWLLGDALNGTQCGSDVQKKTLGSLQHHIQQLFLFFTSDDIACAHATLPDIPFSPYNAVNAGATLPEPIWHCVFDKNMTIDIFKKKLKHALLVANFAKQVEKEGGGRRLDDRSNRMGAQTAPGRELYVDHGGALARYAWIFRTNHFNDRWQEAMYCHDYIPCHLCTTDERDNPKHFLTSCPHPQIARLRAQYDRHWRAAKYTAPLSFKHEEGTRTLSKPQQRDLRIALEILQSMYAIRREAIAAALDL